VTQSVFIYATARHVSAEPAQHSISVRRSRSYILRSPSRRDHSSADVTGENVSGVYGHPRECEASRGARQRVAEAIAQRKTRVLDFDLRAYFDNVRHDRLLEKVAQRVDDKDIMHLLKLMLKASGKKGVRQGGEISPLLSNLYLNEVDKMLERAREVTRNGKYTNVEYARFADDLVVLINAYKRHDWVIGAANKRLREEFAKLQVEINDEKSRRVDLSPSDRWRHGSQRNNGEHRRTKTDRLDTELLKRAFFGWLRGERGHCSMARVPTIAEEDAKRPNRERECLVERRPVRCRS
jgi:hypothetical protein